jgi:hypothetical protein
MRRRFLLNDLEKCFKVELRQSIVPDYPIKLTLEFY